MPIERQRTIGAQGVGEPLIEKEETKRIYIKIYLLMYG